MFAQDPPLFGRSAGICRLRSWPLILLASLQQSPNLVYAAGVRNPLSAVLSDIVFGGRLHLDLHRSARGVIGRRQQCAL